MGLLGLRMLRAVHLTCVLLCFPYSGHAQPSSVFLSALSRLSFAGKTLGYTARRLSSLIEHRSLLRCCASYIKLRSVCVVRSEERGWECGGMMAAARATTRANRATGFLLTVALAVCSCGGGALGFVVPASSSALTAAAAGAHDRHRMTHPA